MGIAKRFTEHPASVGESYGEHMRFALRFSGNLAVASGQALIHAAFPWVCSKSASATIKALHAELCTGARGALDEAEPAPVTHSTMADVADPFVAAG